MALATGKLGVLSIFVAVSVMLRFSWAEEPDILHLTPNRGESVILPCPTNTSYLAVSWTKIVGDGEENVASAASGLVTITSLLRGRVRLQTANLVIDELKLSDSGLYKCHAIGASGFGSSFVLLNVTAAPDVTVAVSEKHTLDSNGLYTAAICYAKGGKPQAEITWTNEAGETQRSRSSTSPTELDSYDVTSELRLAAGLPNVSTGAGVSELVTASRQSYVCIVKHQNFNASQEISKSVNVHLMYPPAVQIHFLGNRLTCEAVGHPSPKITWFLPNGDQRNVKSLYLNEATLGDGRYACTATSVLKPSATSTIQVQRAKDLPALFRTRIVLNTSVPISASGFAIDCSAEATMMLDTSSLKFKWMRNDAVIDERSRVYSIISRSERLSSTKMKIMSSLRFADIRRIRDDAIFKCRLINTTLISGFVTAVERAINLTVDYPPSSNDMRLTTVPRSGIVEEGEEVKLTCSTSSRPKSTCSWHFQGEKLISNFKNGVNKNELVLTDVQRYQAGIYSCVASNYVPGNARKEIQIVVRFPPSNIFVSQSDNILSCVAKSGSVPPPLYRWIYPNGTSTNGNQSSIQLPAAQGGVAALYMCVVHNGLGIESNGTYVQMAGPMQNIGPLSVTEFAIFVAVGAFVLIALLCTIVWTVRKRASRRSANEKLQRTLKKYLEFSEPPESGAAPIKPHRTSTSIELAGTSTMHIRPEAQRSEMPLEGYSNNSVKSFRSVEITPRKNIESQAGFTTTRTSQSMQTFGLRHDQISTEHLAPVQDSHSCLEIDGSGIEIVQNETLHSLKSVAPCSVDSSSTTTPRQRPEESTTLPRGASNVVERRAISPAGVGDTRYRRLQGMPSGKYPMQFFQATFPRGHVSSMSAQYRPHPPMGVVMPGYDSTLYNDTWRRGASHYSYPTHVHSQAARDFDSQQSASSGPTSNADSTASTAASEDFVQSSRARSMSLSESDASSTTRSNRSSPYAKPSLAKAELHSSAQASKRPLRSPSGSGTISPFDSGNDSVKSMPLATKKQQSLTLV